MLLKNRRIKSFSHFKRFVGAREFASVRVTLVCQTHKSQFGRCFRSSLKRMKSSSIDWLCSAIERKGKLTIKETVEEWTKRRQRTEFGRFFYILASGRRVFRCENLWQSLTSKICSRNFVFFCHSKWKRTERKIIDTCRSTTPITHNKVEWRK